MFFLPQGHPEPEDIPVQLDVVPPTLARRVVQQKDLVRVQNSQGLS